MSGAGNGQFARAVGRDCAELATAVAMARQSIAQGGHADLESLVERLRALLDGVGELPRPGQQGLLPQLMGLAEEIEELGGTIAAERQRCSEALARGETSARVAAAYAKTHLN